MISWDELCGFEERVVVVTGAGNGIGAATARRFGERGATVLLVDREPESADAIAAELGRSAVLGLDITAHGAAELVVEHAEELGGIDVLVNAAGKFPHHATLDLPVEDWDGVLDLNLRATFRLAQSCARHMTDRTGGAIVNVASISAARPNRDMAAYSASKGAVVSLTRALAVDLGPTISVNAVAPGPITDTAGARRGLPDDPAEARAAIDAYGRLLPLARTGQADDVARLILFLASDAASFITGQTVTIDGGRTLV